MKKRRHHKSKIVNVVDHLDKEIVNVGEDSTELFQMSEDIQDILINIPEAEPREASESLAEIPNIVDMWKEIKRHLTGFEYQLFELRYRFQRKPLDIAKLVGYDPASVTRTLQKATIKLRSAFSD